MHLYALFWSSCNIASFYTLSGMALFTTKTISTYLQTESSKRPVAASSVYNMPKRVRNTPPPEEPVDFAVQAFTALHINGSGEQLHK